MFQRITLIGRVGSDPEMRYTPGGDPVTNFNLATTTTRSKDSSPNCPKGWKESYNKRNWEITVWWKVTCWRKLAEIVNEYVSKGSEVFVEGAITGEPNDGILNPRIWVGQDGEPRANFELTAQNVKFLGGRGSGSDGETRKRNPRNQRPADDGEDTEDWAF